MTAFKLSLFHLSGEDMILQGQKKKNKNMHIVNYFLFWFLIT